MTKRTARRMTLIEILVVAAIAVIVMGLILGASGAIRRSAYRSQTESILHKIDGALRSFHTDFEHYPYSWAEGDGDNDAGSDADDDDNSSRANRLDDDLDGTIDESGAESQQNDTSTPADFGEDSFMLYLRLCDVPAGWVTPMTECAPGEGLVATNASGGSRKEYSDYLKGEIEKDFIWEDADSGTTYFKFVDPWGTPIIYFFQTKKNERANTDGGPDDGNYYWRPTSSPYPKEGFEREFELWSLGPDQLCQKGSSGTSYAPDPDKRGYSADNITVTDFK